MKLIPARFRWILLLSLALNLALAAYLVMRPSPETRTRGFAMPPPHVIASVLSAQGQSTLKEVVDQHRSQIRPALQAHAAARRELQKLLRQPQVDHESLNQAFVDLRQRESGTSGSVHQMLLELALRLSVEDRHKLADLLDRPRFRGERRNRARGEERQPPAQSGSSNSSADTARPR